MPGKKKIGIWMYQNDNGHIPTEMLTTELCERGFAVEKIFDMRNCYVLNGNVYTADGLNLTDLDAVYHMNADQQSEHQRDILLALSDSGVKLLNSHESFMKCRDKFRANLLLRKAGLKVPESILLGSKIPRNILVDIFATWGSAVFKLRTGHGASGIIKFSDPEQFIDFVDATAPNLENFYLEQFIDFAEHDYRVEVLNNQIIGGYSRRKNHSFKTNISAGGEMIPSELSDQVHVAIAAAKALNIQGTIVDMVRSSKDGNIYILEVNPLLGIFVESAMQAGSKMPVTNAHPSYSYDQKKITAIANALENLIND